MNIKSTLFFAILAICKILDISSLAIAEDKPIQSCIPIDLKGQCVEGGYEICSGSQRAASITWNPDSQIPGRCNIGFVKVEEGFRGCKLSTELYRVATDGCDSVYSIHTRDNYDIWKQAMCKTQDPLEAVRCTPEAKSLARLGYDPVECKIYTKNTAVTYARSPPGPTSSCLNGPTLPEPPSLPDFRASLPRPSGSVSAAGLGRGVGLRQLPGALVKCGKQNLQNAGKVLVVSSCLDPKGLAKELCVAGGKGVVRGVPLCIGDMAVRATTRCAVEYCGGNENQSEGAAAMAGLGYWTACGAKAGGPVGGAVGAIGYGGTELVIGGCKMTYYAGYCVYNDGICESVSNWWDIGYNPIDYWCGW